MKNRKFICFLLCLLLATLFLSACTSSKKGVSDIEDIESETETVESNAIEPLEVTLRGSVEDSNTSGDALRGELWLSDWVRLEEWETLYATYSNMIVNTLKWPEEVVPLLTLEKVQKDVNIKSIEEALALVGYLYIENIAEDKDFTEENPYKAQTTLSIKQDDSTLDLAEAYGSYIYLYVPINGETVRLTDENVALIGEHDWFRTSTMTSNHMAIPFIMLQRNVFTPDNPNGDGLLPSGEFELKVLSGYTSGQTNNNVGIFPVPTFTE